MGWDIKTVNMKLVGQKNNENLTREGTGQQLKFDKRIFNQELDFLLVIR